MLYSFPANFAGGAFYLRFNHSPIVSCDDYFAVMDAVRPMLDRGNFKACTIGFYINRIGILENNSTITLRLNYFSINVPETIGVVEQYVKESNLAVLMCEHPNRNKSIVEYNDGSPTSELSFKNFLDADTRICLEMLENFGVSNTRNLVQQYLINDLPRVIRPEDIMQADFTRYSPSFKHLVDRGLGRRFWDDLVRVHHPPRDIGAHFMANMLCVSEPPYYAETLEKLLAHP